MKKQLATLTGILIFLLCATVVRAAPVADAGGPYYVTPTNSLVNLVGIGSADAGFTVVLFEWDFESDGVFDFSSSTSGNASHYYTNLIAPGDQAYASFRVTDNAGATSSDSALVTFASDIPAPATLALLGIGLAGLGLSRRRKVR